MRVLHLISSLNPVSGGVSQAVLTMIKGLDNEGINNEAATIDSPAAPYLSGLPFPVYPKGPGKTAWQYAPPLLDWLQLHLPDYDAVIVHGLWQYQTFAARKAWKKLKGKKPKLFVMPHGMLDPYFQKAKGRRIKAIRNWFFWKWNEQKLVNGADAVLFTCETELLLAREPFIPYRPRLEKVVGLGVEAPPACTTAMQVAFQEKIGADITDYWLFISRIHEKKGVDLLIAAYLLLKKEAGNLPPLVIAGPGLDTPFGKEVQQAAAADKDIYFPGMLTGDAKWGAFYGCEVFILPSHQENFGIAVVEALACRKPVLISNQVNIWREIVKGGAGLAAADTLDGICTLLRTWNQFAPAEKARMAASTTHAFNENFGIPAATSNLIKLL